MQCVHALHIVWSSNFLSIFKSTWRPERSEPWSCPMSWHFVSCTTISGNRLDITSICQCLRRPYRQSEPENTDSTRLPLLDSIQFVRWTLRTEFLQIWVLSSSDQCPARLLLKVQRTWWLGELGYWGLWPSQSQWYGSKRNFRISLGSTCLWPSCTHNRLRNIR